MPGPLDTLIFGYRTVLSGVTELLQRNRISFDPATFSVEDDPITKSTKVTGLGGGGDSASSALYVRRDTSQTMAAGESVHFPLLLDGGEEDWISVDNPVDVGVFTITKPGIYLVSFSIYVVANSTYAAPSFGLAAVDGNFPLGDAKIISSIVIDQHTAANGAYRYLANTSAVSVLAGDTPLRLRNWNTTGTYVANVVDYGTYPANGGNASVAQLTVVKVT